ncbi:MAG: L-2,4-diaminobutyric acid acetyltransferase [Hyphomicrobiaceae bacterium]
MTPIVGATNLLSQQLILTTLSRCHPSLKEQQEKPEFSGALSGEDSLVQPHMRQPVAADAVGIHRLVVASEALEANSLYAYLLICTHFAATSLVAVSSDGAIAGFVAGYCPPADPATIFVWQIGVDANSRGLGLGTALLETLASSPACSNVHYLEATVAPDNQSSDAMFRGFARRRETECVVRDYFTREHFGGASHEDEPLYRIGPLRPVTQVHGAVAQIQKGDTHEQAS